MFQKISPPRLCAFAREYSGRQDGASHLKFGSARRAAPTLGFSIRGDLLHSRVNLFHSAAVGILFEGSAGNGEWASVNP
jgi:hypothetical protein